MSINIIDSILIVLAIALFVIVVFRYIHLPVVLGYLFVGALIGPHALGWIPDVKVTKDLAEFGVVFLMFTIGLEFSFSKLLTLRKPVFLLGGLQVCISLIVTTLIGIWVGMTPLSALVVGGIVAMSSTALVVKQLSDQVELHLPHGTASVGILLFQDLSVVPLLILMSTLSVKGGEPILMVLAWALIKGFVAYVLITAVGRWLLRPLFQIIAATRVVEFFTVAVLLVTLGSAWLTHVMDLSYALGAFLAGIMLGETEYHHQIEVEIRPFRDVLLGLFFVTVGMLMNVSTWLGTWEWILLLLVALIIGKAILIMLISRLSGNDFSDAVRTGIILGQGGEFGFAVLTVALSNELIPKDYGQVILSALVISIAISPIFIHYNKKITQLLFPKIFRKREEEIQKEIESLGSRLKNHVIICGYGRRGQNIARVLQRIKFKYLALDTDPMRIENARLLGDPVIYGNATRLEILESAGLKAAKALVISIENVRSVTKILDQVRQINKTIPILVHCKEENEMKVLQEHGASQIITEVFEESLTLTYQLLQLLDIPVSQISQVMREMRAKHYDLLRRVFPGSIESEYLDEETKKEQVRPLMLTKASQAVGKKLSELAYKEAGIDIIAVRREEAKLLKPHGNIKLMAGDILIVYGTVEQLDAFEEIILH